MNDLTFMVPMPAPMPIALKNTVSRDVISGPEQENFIINVVKKALEQGKLAVEGSVSELALDTVETSSASIQKGSFKEIGAIGEAITISSEAIFRSFIKVGVIGSTFDETGQYQFQLIEDILVRGNIANLDVFKFSSKSNMLGLGIDNEASDNFMTGIFMKKKDNFSSQGSVLLDKVGIFSLPYGQFLDDSIYAPITLTKKRFDGARTSVRCAYLSSDFDFGNKLLQSSTFNLNQKTFIESLNNFDNQPTIYYTNFECNNAMLHGGVILGGVGKSFEIVLTKTNNTEEKFITCNLEAGVIEYDKPFSLSMSDFNIESAGSVGFTTNNALNALFSSSRITFFRQTQLANNIPIQILNDNLELRDSLSNIIAKFSKKSDNFTDSRIEDITLNYFTGTFLVQGRFGDVQLQIDDFTKISGPFYNPGSAKSATNNNDNPILQIQNKENFSSISNLPTTKTYIQSKFLNASSNVSFAFANVCTTTQNDFIFSGYAVITSTDSTDVSHLHLRLDGSFNNKDTTNPTILTKTVIKRNTLTLESITFTESVDYLNANNPVLTLELTNTTSRVFNISIKLEVIAI